MSNIARIMQQAAAGAAAGELLAIEDVFSTYLYTGNGSTQTITNGIDLAGEGGLVWVKSRTSTTSNWLMDTERGMNGVDAFLSSNTANPAYDASSNGLTPNADGFSHVSGNADLNASGTNYASWTWRKAPRWFDCVTYTGNGTSPRTISHNLGVIPGCIIVKAYSVAGENWTVYHRGLNVNGDNAPETDGIYLNLTNAAIDESGFWNDTAPTDTNFTVGANLNSGFGGGVQYVAYLFAHDPLGPSGDGSDGLIACGSYTGNGTSIGPTVTLGWEPQWILIKRASGGTEDWYIFDSMRGMTVGGSDAYLMPDNSSEEFSFDGITPTSTGFNAANSFAATNASGSTYIYIAIRRGPMRAPTSGTEVFTLGTSTSDTSGYTLTSNFPVDSYLYGRRDGAAHGLMSRMTNGRLLTTSTSAEGSTAGFVFWDSNVNVRRTGLLGNASTVDYALRRAPGFFDVVAYTGDGVAGRTVPHNLGVAPELFALKRRDTTGNWNIYFNTGNPSVNNGLGLLRFNTTDADLNGTFFWDNTHPTDSVFTVGSNSQVNASGGTYIAYLFATLPGISKVGSYTGNGSNQTINCGFTGGARFVLIKRTDSTGDWYVWDTARGIVTGNDPHLSLNTAAAEVTTDDSIDPDSSGFIVNQDAATNINVSSASYIYLVIA